jgi:hypothetical protein
VPRRRLQYLALPIQITYHFHRPTSYRLCFSNVYIQLRYIYLFRNGACLADMSPASRKSSLLPTHQFNIAGRRPILIYNAVARITLLRMAHNRTCNTRAPWLVFHNTGALYVYHLLPYPNYFHGAVASLKEGYLVLATSQNMAEEAASIDCVSTTTTIHVSRVHTLNANDTQCCPWFTAMVYFHFYHT